MTITAQSRIRLAASINPLASPHLLTDLLKEQRELVHAVLMPGDDSKQDAAGIQGPTPVLHYAVQRGAPNALELLLSTPGADPNVRMNGGTLLHTAIAALKKHQHTALLRSDHSHNQQFALDNLHKILFFLGNHVDVNAPDAEKLTPFARAAMLVQQNDFPDLSTTPVYETPFCKALMMLCEAGANPNAPLQPGEDVPLIKTISDGNRCLMRSLLWAGADPDARSVKNPGNNLNSMVDARSTNAVSSGFYGTLANIKRHAKETADRILSKNLVPLEVLCDKQHANRPRAFTRAYGTSDAINHFFSAKHVEKFGVDDCLKLALHLIDTLPPYCTPHFRVAHLMREATLAHAPDESALVQYMRGSAETRKLS